MCPHGYHHSGSMATPALGTYIYASLNDSKVKISQFRSSIYIYIQAVLFGYHRNTFK